MQGFGLGLGLAQRRAGVSDAAILALFANGEQGAWYDPSDRSTLFEDAAGTIPVTGDGRPVGLIRDKSGRGNHASQSTVASKPTYRTNGVLSWLAFDGVDDFLVTGSIDFTGTSKLTYVAGVRKLSDAAIGCVFELSTDSGSLGNNFALFAPPSVSSPGYGFRSQGSKGQSLLTATGYPSPHTGVLTLVSDIAVQSLVGRVNGAQAGTMTTTQATAFGNYPLYIGRRGGTAIPFTGDIFGLIIRGALTADSQLTQAERWMAKRTGVAI